MAYHVFIVDVEREASKDFGVLVKTGEIGLTILDFKPDSLMLCWNERTKQVFAEDQIQIGDVVLSVNGIGPKESLGSTTRTWCEPMLKEFRKASQVILAVVRFEGRMPASLASKRKSKGFESRSGFAVASTPSASRDSESHSNEVSLVKMTEQHQLPDFVLRADRPKCRGFQKGLSLIHI